MRLHCPSLTHPLKPETALPCLDVDGFIFEFDGVLYDASVWRRWLFKLLTRMGLHTHYETFFDVWEHHYGGRVYAGQGTLREALEKYLLSAGLSQAMIDEVIPALRAQFKTIWAEARPLPGAVAALSQLRAAGYPLVVSADMPYGHQELTSRICRLGLGECLEDVVSSVELKCVKPDAKSYQAAIDVLGLRAARIAFLGTKPAHLGGAKQMGLMTVAVSCPDWDEADCHVERLDQVCAFMLPRTSQRQAG